MRISAKIPLDRLEVSQLFTPGSHHLFFSFKVPSLFFDTPTAVWVVEVFLFEETLSRLHHGGVGFSSAPCFVLGSHIWSLKVRFFYIAFP